MEEEPALQIELLGHLLDNPLALEEELLRLFQSGVVRQIDIDLETAPLLLLSVHETDVLEDERRAHREDPDQQEDEVHAPAQKHTEHPCIAMIHHAEGLSYAVFSQLNTGCGFLASSLWVGRVR